MKIVVIVKGGMVRKVYATSYAVDVEVIDLDVPEGATAEEIVEFNAMEKQVEEMRQSADWLPVW